METNVYIHTPTQSIKAIEHFHFLEILSVARNELLRIGNKEHAKTCEELKEHLIKSRNAEILYNIKNQ